MTPLASASSPAVSKRGTDFAACPHCDKETYCDACWAHVRHTDECRRCADEFAAVLPENVWTPIIFREERDGGGIAVYRCERGHVWRCSWGPT